VKKKGFNDSVKIQHQHEINHGAISFSTNIIKPLSILISLDTEKRTKTYENGVLTLKFPKKKQPGGVFF